MANICKTSISVVGLMEPPETFVKAISRAMFDIDLDNMDLQKWGCAEDGNGRFFDVDWDKESDMTVKWTQDSEGNHHQLITKRDPSNGLASGIKVLNEIFPTTWYQELVNQFAFGQRSYSELCVLYVLKPFVKCGVSVPRFYVETKWAPPYGQLKKASEAFPDLLFHVGWFITQDGPSGEFVLGGGKLLEKTESGASWYLFDEIVFPSMSLLPKYMPLTLAHRGAAAVDDATELIKRLHRIVNATAFVDSPYSLLRDQCKTDQARETLDALLAYMEGAAKSLDFEGVFLPNNAVDGSELPHYVPPACELPVDDVGTEGKANASAD